MRIPEYPPTRMCPCCNKDIDDEETVYEINNNYWVCEECAKEYITENMDLDEVAELMQIDRKASWEAYDE